MRKIYLINDLEYNKRFKEIGENIYDGNYYKSNSIELAKEVYKADELVNIPEKNKKYIDNVTNSFVETFKERGGATEEQINFANETAKIIYGDLKEDVITVIPAPCGFGKSSITLEILKNQINAYKNKETTNGIIVVTDRLNSLHETENELKKIGMDGYTCILESWNEDICINKTITKSDYKMCNYDNCPYYSKCQIYIQQKDQSQFPILMITNARLKECGQTIQKYSEYDNGKRTVLLIDERPDILDIVKVDQGLLNNISTEISRCEFDTVAEKTLLETKWEEISGMIVSKMQRFRKNYKRFIVSNINNEVICKNDNEFMDLWEKYMGSNYKRELNHIHSVLTQGGFYVFEKKQEFISTIGSKNLRDMYSDAFKTIIFDGTALYDQLYAGMYSNNRLKFLDIENTRLYQNLYINAYMQHKITKTKFKDKKYLEKACANFVNIRMSKGFKNKGYIVSYKPQSIKLAQYLNDNVKGRISKLSDDECHYFGNTKGKNDMSDCNIMFQFGWDTLPDYDYVIQWLSILGTWDIIIEHCSNIDKAIEMSEELIIKDRSKTVQDNGIFVNSYRQYEFGVQNLNNFKMLSIVTNFYQEVHRIKLRKYTCTEEKIEVNVFSQQNIILEMIKQLFPRCHVDTKKEQLECFKLEKKKSFTKKDGTQTIPQKIIGWINDTWNGEEIKTKDMLDKIGITQRQFNKAKENDNDMKELLKKYSIKRGIYQKIS